VILDFTIEVIAIARQSELSAKITGIANSLKRLMNMSNFAKQNQVNFEISDISDPTDFITYLNESINIAKFWVTFSKPNAFDVDDFFKPLQKALEEINGDKGKTILEGDNLYNEPLEELARSAAATGDDAGARLKISEDKYEIKRLKKNEVFMHSEDILDKEKLNDLLNEMNKLYSKIRGKTEENDK
jgi:hypothetical protein